MSGYYVGVEEDLVILLLHSRMRMLLHVYFCELLYLLVEGLHSRFPSEVFLQDHDLPSLSKLVSHHDLKFAHVLVELLFLDVKMEIDQIKI